MLLLLLLPLLLLSDVACHRASATVAAASAAVYCCCLLPLLLLPNLSKMLSKWTRNSAATQRNSAAGLAPEATHGSTTTTVFCRRSTQPQNDGYDDLPQASRMEPTFAPLRVPLPTRRIQAVQPPSVWGKSPRPLPSQPSMTNRVKRYARSLTSTKMRGRRV